MAEQLHAIVHGRVQGVSFRYNTLQYVNRAGGITGWVRNRYDYTVEVLAEGERPALEALLRFLQDGPPGARVTDVEAEWWAASGKFDHFEITG